MKKVRAIKDIMDNITGELIAEARTEFEVFDTEGNGQVWVEYGDTLLLTEDEYEVVA